MKRMMILAAMAMVGQAGMAQAGCEEDLAMVERVVPTLVITGDLRREVEALQTEAALSCQGGDAAAADAATRQLWSKLVESDDVAPPTVAEVTVDPCSEGMATVESAAANEARSDSVGGGIAERLIEDARAFCAADDMLRAEEKLSFAWAILEDDKDE